MKIYFTEKDMEGEVSPIKSLCHGQRRRKIICDVLRNAKRTLIILHGRKMMAPLQTNAPFL